MADENENQEFQGTKEPPPKNLLLVLFVLINTALLGVVAFFQFMNFQEEKNKPKLEDVVKAQMQAAFEAQAERQESGEAKEQDGILFPLESFTANLAQGDGPRRYVRMNAVLKFSKDSNEEEFKGRKPQIRDTIISILNSKRPEDLLKVEGKNYLKEEIKAAINTFLVDGHVIDVYYVGFQIN